MIYADLLYFETLITVGRHMPYINFITEFIILPLVKAADRKIKVIFWFIAPVKTLCTVLMAEDNKTPVVLTGRRPSKIARKCADRN